MCKMTSADNQTKQLVKRSVIIDNWNGLPLISTFKGNVVNIIMRHVPKYVASFSTSTRPSGHGSATLHRNPCQKEITFVFLYLDLCRLAEVTIACLLLSPNTCTTPFLHKHRPLPCQLQIEKNKRSIINRMSPYGFTLICLSLVFSLVPV